MNNNNNDNNIDIDQSDAPVPVFEAYFDMNFHFAGSEDFKNAWPENRVKLPESEDETTTIEVGRKDEEGKKRENHFFLSPKSSDSYRLDFVAKEFNSRKEDTSFSQKMLELEKRPFSRWRVRALKPNCIIHHSDVSKESFMLSARWVFLGNGDKLHFLCKANCWMTWTFAGMESFKVVRDTLVHDFDDRLLRISVLLGWVMDKKQDELNALNDKDKETWTKKSKSLEQHWAKEKEKLLKEVYGESAKRSYPFLLSEIKESASDMLIDIYRKFRDCKEGNGKVVWGSQLYVLIWLKPVSTQLINLFQPVWENNGKLFEEEKKEADAEKSKTGGTRNTGLRTAKFVDTEFKEPCFKEENLIDFRFKDLLIGRKKDKLILWNGDRVFLKQKNEPDIGWCMYLDPLTARCQIPFLPEEKSPFVDFFVSCCRIGGKMNAILSKAKNDKNFKWFEQPLPKELEKIGMEKSEMFCQVLWDLGMYDIHTQRNMGQMAIFFKHKRYSGSLKKMSKDQAKKEGLFPFLQVKDGIWCLDRKAESSESKVRSDLIALMYGRRKKVSDAVAALQFEDFKTFEKDLGETVKLWDHANPVAIWLESRLGSNIKTGLEKKKYLDEFCGLVSSETEGGDSQIQKKSFLEAQEKLRIALVEMEQKMSLEKKLKTVMRFFGDIKSQKLPRNDLFLFKQNFEDLQSNVSEYVEVMMVEPLEQLWNDVLKHYKIFVSAIGENLWQKTEAIQEAQQKQTHSKEELEERKKNLRKELEKCFTKDLEEKLESLQNALKNESSKWLKELEDKERHWLPFTQKDLTFRDLNKFERKLKILDPGLKIWLQNHFGDPWKKFLEAVESLKVRYDQRLANEKNKEEWAQLSKHAGELREILMEAVKKEQEEIKTPLEYQQEFEKVPSVEEIFYFWKNGDFLAVCWMFVLCRNAYFHLLDSQNPNPRTKLLISFLWSALECFLPYEDKILDLLHTLN